MSGYNINWKTNLNATSEETFNNISNSSKDSVEIIALNENINYLLSTSSDSSHTNSILKPQLKYVSILNKQSDTLKSKPKKATHKKNKKAIDSTKDSKTSLVLGILSFFLIIFGVSLLLLVLSFSSFLYGLYMLAMLSIIASIIFGIIGIVKALKVLKYLKSNPEETKKNKRKATAGLIFSALALLPYILFLVYYISAIIIHYIR